MLDAFINSALTVILVIFALLLVLCMIKAVIGPRVGDRIVCVNMMGTIVMVIISILAVKVKEGYLADICIIYAMISFLAVVVLCKIYLGVYLDRKNRGQKLSGMQGNGEVPINPEEIEGILEDDHISDGEEK